jgi:hypothetical protein
MRDTKSKTRTRQDLNLRGRCPADFKSAPLTTPARVLLVAVSAHGIYSYITLTNSKIQLPEQICRNIRSKRPFLCSYALSTVGLPCTRV